MFVLIFGKDDYRIKKKTKEIIADYQDTTSTEIKLEAFEKEKANFISLKEDLNRISMFNSKKVFLFRNSFANKDFKQNFLEQAESVLESQDLVIFIEQRVIPKNDSLLKFFRVKGALFQLNPLSRQKVEEYVQKQLQAKAIKIDRIALTKLMSYVGNDLWRTSIELKKIIAFCAQKKVVRSEDIDLLIKPSIESAIFETLEAIAGQDKEKALFLISQHMRNGDSPFYLLSMINWQFRNLLLIKEQEGKEYSQIVKELKPLSPFVIRKNLALTKQFSRERLEKIYFKIFKIDIAIKTGKIKPELALELLIADI